MKEKRSHEVPVFINRTQLVWGLTVFQINIIDTGIIKTGPGKIVFKYQERVGGRGNNTPLKPFFSSYSGNKAVIIDSSLRIIKQQKKIASQWLT